MNLIHKNRWTLLALLCVHPLLGMCVDLITPSLPVIQRDFLGLGFSSQNLISIYFLGMGLGLFSAGLLCDFIGRRTLSLAGLLIFSLVSLFPTFSQNADTLILTRLIQGLAAGAFGIAARSSIPGLVEPQKIPRMAAFVAMLWGFGPIIGPVIGGYFQHYIGWQANFYFFAIYGLLAFTLVAFALPETIQAHSSPSFKVIMSRFREILSNKYFVGTTLLMGTSFSLIVFFNTLAPFVIEDVFGKDPIYFGRLAMVMGASFLYGTLFCQYLVKRYSVEILIRYTILPLFIITLLFFLLGDSIVFFTCSNIIVFFGAGILYPAGMGKSLSFFKNFAGIAGAFLTSMVMLISGLSGGIASLISPKNTASIQILDLVYILLCGAIYWLILHERKIKYTDNSPELRPTQE